jgi:hypothetical protein
VYFAVFRRARSRAGSCHTAGRTTASNKHVILTQSEAAVQHFTRNLAYRSPSNRERCLQQ